MSATRKRAPCTRNAAEEEHVQTDHRERLAAHAGRYRGGNGGRDQHERARLCGICQRVQSDERTDGTEAKPDKRENAERREQHRGQSEEVGRLSRKATLAEDCEDGHDDDRAGPGDREHPPAGRCRVAVVVLEQQRDEARDAHQREAEHRDSDRHEVEAADLLQPLERGGERDGRVSLIGVEDGAENLALLVLAAGRVTEHERRRRKETERDGDGDERPPPCVGPTDRGRDASGEQRAEQLTDWPADSFGGVDACAGRERIAVSE
jgi:hypothetical protein